jgi:hypothetical protein
MDGWLWWGGEEFALACEVDAGTMTFDFEKEVVLMKSDCLDFSMKSECLNFGHYSCRSQLKWSFLLSDCLDFSMKSDCLDFSMKSDRLTLPV